MNGNSYFWDIRKSFMRGSPFLRGSTTKLSNIPDSAVQITVHYKLCYQEGKFYIETLRVG